jgi:hypothetical protein
MGLDMYLYRKTFLYTGDYIEESEQEKVIVTKGGEHHPYIKNERIKYVVEEVGYWRKANQIHKWFVDNVQNGVDNCGEYLVKEDQLANLLETCKLILDKDPSKASVLLPVQSGFFFGSTDYDQYYFKDLENTVKIIESLFEKDLDGGSYLEGDVYYSSSW